MVCRDAVGARYRDADDLGDPHLQLVVDQAAPFVASVCLGGDRPFRRGARYRALADPACGLRALRRDAALRVGKLCEGQAARLIAGCTRSDEHTSELQSLMRISYADFS